MKKKIIILISVLLVLMVGVGVFFVVKEKREKKAEEVRKQEEIKKQEKIRKADEERIEKEEENKKESFSMGGNKFLDIKVPRGMKFQQKGNIVFIGKDNFIFLITLTQEEDLDENVKDVKIDLNKIFEEDFKEKALEKKLTIKELKGKVFDGFYFMPITDTQSKNEGDDYKYFASAESFVNEGLLGSSYLDRENNEENLNQWLEMLKNVEIRQGENVNYVDSKNKKIRVKINSNSFQNNNENPLSSLEGNDDGTDVSILILEDFETKERCFSMFEDKILKNKQSGKNYDYKFTKKDDFLKEEYVEKLSVNGGQILIKNVFKMDYLNKCCIATHLSRQFYPEKDEEKVLDDYLNKIEIIEN